MLQARKKKEKARPRARRLKIAHAGNESAPPVLIPALFYAEVVRVIIGFGRCEGNEVQMIIAADVQVGRAMEAVANVRLMNELSFIFELSNGRLGGRGRQVDSSKTVRSARGTHNHYSRAKLLFSGVT